MSGPRAFLASVVALVVAGMAGAAWNHPGALATGSLDAIARILFLSALWLAGARLAAWVVGSRLTGLAHVAWDGAGGLVLLVSTLLLIGLLPHGFDPVTVRVVLAAFVGAGALRARLDPTSRLPATEGKDASTRGAWILLAAAGAAGLIWDRVPPVFFDARAYHFAQPELWLIEGRIAPVEWSLHSWFPPGASVLYGAGLALSGSTWANDFNLLVGLGLLALTVELGRRSFGPVGGLLGALVLLSMPLTIYALAIPAADLAHGMFTFGSLGCLLLVRLAPGEPCWLRRAAWLGAGAALTKYLGLLVPIGLGVAWLATRRTTADGRHDLRARSRDVLRFVAPALLLLLPWMLANLAVEGNPVAPMASEVFATRGLVEGGVASFRADARGGLPGWRDVENLVPRWITGSEAESRIYPTPAWGFVPVVLAPLLFLGWRAEPRVRAPLVLALASIAIWFVTFRWERFLVSASTFLALALAGSALAVWRRGGPLRAVPVLAALVGVGSLALASLEVSRFTGGVRVAVGVESPRDFVELALPGVRLFRRCGELLDPGSDRVLLLGEMRHFGLALPRAAPTGFNTHPLVQALEADPVPEQVHRALRARGFTHLLVDFAQVARGARRYPSLAPLARDPEILRRYLASLGAPLAIEDNVALFRIPG